MGLVNTFTAIGDALSTVEAKMLGTVLQTGLMFGLPEASPGKSCPSSGIPPSGPPPMGVPDAPSTPWNPAGPSEWAPASDIGPNSPTGPQQTPYSDTAPPTEMENQPGGRMPNETVPYQYPGYDPKQFSTRKL